MTFARFEPTTYCTLSDLDIRKYIWALAMVVWEKTDFESQIIKEYICPPLKNIAQLYFILKRSDLQTNKQGKSWVKYLYWRHCERQAYQILFI